MRLLEACIYRHWDFLIGDMVPIDLLRYIIQVLAADILQEPSKFMQNVNKRTARLLNSRSAEIFKYNEEDYASDASTKAFREQYKQYIANLERLEKEKEKSDVS